MRGYVVERTGRFYAVIYEGRDPVSGRERRRWHAAGTDRAEAERLASALAAEVRTTGGLPGLSVGRYLLHTWLPRKRISLRPSTWDGYRRNVELHVLPRIGHVPLRRLREHHIDSLDADLLIDGRADGRGGLDPKTVLEVHVILHKALADGCRRLPDLRHTHGKLRLKCADNGRDHVAEPGTASTVTRVAAGLVWSRRGR